MPFAILLVPRRDITVLINPTRLRRDYREFKMYNQFTYPALFFFIGLIKPLLIFGIAIAAALILLPHVTQGIQVSKSTEVIDSSAAPQRLAEPVLPSVPSVVAMVTPNVGNRYEKPVDETVVVEQIVTRTPRVVGADWILSRKPGEFTVQFASSPDKPLMVEFASFFDSNAEIAIYPFKRTPTNRPVYGLASGVYPSFESAQLAIEKLPASIREYDPWIRPLKTLQTQVRSFLDG